MQEVVEEKICAVESDVDFILSHNKGAG